jgi:iron complex outermembrane receptor protein
MKQYYTWLFILAFFIPAGLLAQTRISGTVTDAKTLELIPGANVVIQGTQIGTTTDFDGKFELSINRPLPVVVEVTFIGYEKKLVRYERPGHQRIGLNPDQEILQEVSVVERRLSEKQKESALTVEALDIMAIKETPSISFYDGLGNLKGVDLVSASLGFKIINTRGFNSTAPVRSLQVIDGVDNQAPGLNFSLGNFLGASELDVMNVDIIAGASSAFYGPNAFNGVISMTTKNPFDFRGLSASVKVGERSLGEYAVRWADVYKNRKGREVFAYKLNVYYMHADDWVADNMDPTDDSRTRRDNPGGYDAVNRYGDEIFFNDGGATRSRPGLGDFTRTGIEEIYLVDYDTRNMKLGTSLHYRFRPDVELTYGINYGTGTTVFQGDNRFSLRGIQFVQNKIQLEKKNKWFVRAYATNEDAGNSYDAYFTALKMQETYVADSEWGRRYADTWRDFIPRMQAHFGDRFPNLSTNPPSAATIREMMDQLIAEDPEFFRMLHAEQRQRMAQLGLDPPAPGTAAFDSLFNYITSRSFSDGGSRLVDRSALYHIMGEYKFDPTQFGIFTVGANSRQYRPVSDGTIFSDTNNRIITNSEIGGFLGWERKFYYDNIKASGTIRIDKNENFDWLSSQAFSVIYQLDEINTLRLSFSSAIRNPTLQDQYLYYNVGRAILLGNLSGYDSLVTVDDVSNFLGASPQERLNYQWEYFSVNPVKPERVQTIEAGYRTTLWKAVYVDLNYYYNWYRDFIGFIIGVDIDYDADDPVLGVRGAQAYRISANAADRVTTQGFSAGVNYYFKDFYALTGNYTWNVLNTKSDDPIIPAFNTPEHKYNISFSARDLTIPRLRLRNIGFNISYKWIQGFLFEGSPQFTGFIDSYDMLDAMVSYSIPKSNLTFKLGASNLLNNRIFQVYGGPRVGRLSYFSVLFDLENK